MNTKVETFLNGVHEMYGPDIADECRKVVGRRSKGLSPDEGLTIVSRVLQAEQKFAQIVPRPSNSLAHPYGTFDFTKRVLPKDLVD